MEESCQNHKLMSTVQFFQLTPFAFLPIQAVSVCKKGGDELEAQGFQLLFLVSVRLAASDLT